MAGSNKEWLLAIGRRLRAEYDAVKAPIPERLAALVEELEIDTDAEAEAVHHPMDRVRATRGGRPSA
jgi:hypothetical protein